MICDFCNKREAVIYLEQVSNDGHKRKINICMQCAIERGIKPDPKNLGPSIQASIGELFKELSLIDKKAKLNADRMCPVCGIKVSNIIKNGKAGCPECYSVFKKEIDSYMSGKSLMGTYTGSMPARLSKFKSVLNDRISLKHKMDEAVLHEDYEKAAMYRDYLKALSKKSVFGDETEIR